LFVIEIWTICVILKYLNIFLPIVEDEASLCSQNPLLYLIMSHMNPVHTFITHLFTIPCNHLILLLCWSILNSHLKFEIPQRRVLTVACIIALNKILSMRGFQKCSLLLSQTDFFSLPLSLLHKHHLVKPYNYGLSNSVHLPITSSLLKFNLFIKLLLNSLNIYSLLNKSNQVSNTNKQHVKLYINR